MTLMIDGEQKKQKTCPTYIQINFRHLTLMQMSTHANANAAMKIEKFATFKAKQKKLILEQQVCKIQSNFFRITFFAFLLCSFSWPVQFDPNTDPNRN